MKYSFFSVNEVDEIIGESKYILDLKNVISSVVKNSSSVLLCGDKGTGKKLIAKTIYVLSDNETNTTCFCHFDCKNNQYSSFKDFSLDLTKISLFSPNFLLYFEDIDRLELNFQRDLCSFIKSAPSNYKFVYSSERILEDLVEQDKFDSELFFVISTVLINTIPLQQHSEDIPLIVDYYFNKFNSEKIIKLASISEIIKNKLQNKIWHGDIKELRMAIESAFLSSNTSYLTLKDFGFNEELKNDVAGFVHNQLTAVDYENNSVDYSLKTAVDNFKKDYVTKILEENNWNQTKTSKILGIQRTYVIKLMNDLNIKK